MRKFLTRTEFTIGAPVINIPVSHGKTVFLSFSEPCAWPSWNFLFSAFLCWCYWHSDLSVSLVDRISLGLRDQPTCKPVKPVFNRDKPMNNYIFYVECYFLLHSFLISQKSVCQQTKSRYIHLRSDMHKNMSIRSSRILWYSNHSFYYLLQYLHPNKCHNFWPLSCFHYS